MLGWCYQKRLVSRRRLCVSLVFSRVPASLIFWNYMQLDPSSQPQRVCTASRSQLPLCLVAIYLAVE